MLNKKKPSPTFPTTQYCLSLSMHPFLSSPCPVAIERLSPCRQLQALVLRNNSIDAINNIECCRQLWHIDLTGNKVTTNCMSVKLYVILASLYVHLLKITCTLVHACITVIRVIGRKGEKFICVLLKRHDKKGIGCVSRVATAKLWTLNSHSFLIKVITCYI